LVILSGRDLSLDDRNEPDREESPVDAFNDSGAPPGRIVCVRYPETGGSARCACFPPANFRSASGAERDHHLVHIPMERFALAEEVANAALFLASDEASFITASAFVVDGGSTGAYITPE